MPTLTLVVGLGKSGQSIARWLERKNCPYIFFDTRPRTEELLQLSKNFKAKKIFFQTIPDNIWATVSRVISSPGVSLDDPYLRKAQTLQLPIYGDIECLCQEIQAPIVAITGTNGKSTVTSLLGEIAKAHGYCTAVAGNIGTPVLDTLGDGKHYDLWVLELSSYQLEYTQHLNARAATILNISADHLERHKTLANYCTAKQRIYKNCDAVVYNRDDDATKPTTINTASSITSFALTKPPRAQDWGLIEKNNDMYLAQGSTPFLKVTALKLQGRHNWLNALVASALAQQLDIPMTTITQVLQSYQGLPHRSEWLRNVNGVDWINDSKGTNIGATIAALHGIGPAIKGKIVLLIGGVGKGSDYRDLIPAVADFTRIIISFGQDKAKIKAALETTVCCYEVNDLCEATVLAQKNALHGDAVLLSPACASFDMFKDFNHRGEVFRELVQRL